LIFPGVFLLGIQVMALAQEPVLRLKVPPDPNAPSVFLPEPPAAVHVLVQFQDPPTPETLQELAQRGATTVSFIPDNAVLVTMNAAVSLTGLALHYAAPLSPYQKISPLIANEDPVVIRGNYLVEFHRDIDPSAARRVILNSPLLELLENPELARRHLLVRIPDLTREAEALASLAAQDEVAYIFPAAPELIEGLPVGVDLPVAPGLLLASGEVLGQLVSTFGDGWDGPGRNAVTLNYFFSQLTSQLPDLVTKSEIARALAEWAKVAQITWIPDASATADRTVNILFAQGDHGDGFPFDGPGGVLAHTFYPALPAAEPLAGDMHFDDAESWHVGSNFDVFSVALHEIGHALGLGSSDNPESVMYPYYKLRTDLAQDDKDAILSLYAAKSQTAPLALAIDATPGTTTSATVSLSGTVTGGSGTPTVTWNTSAGTSGSALVSGTNWTAASIPLAMGLNSITVTATDTTVSSSSSVSVTRQAVTPPPLALTVNAPAATTTSSTVSLSGTITGGSGTPAVTWSSSTGESGSASVVGTNWAALNIPLAIGFNSITVTASDASGSVSRVVSTTRTAAPPPAGADTTGPALTITYPSSTSVATTLASLTFKGTASDPSGIASVTFSTNTGKAGTASGTAQWTAAIPLLVGFNQVIIRAYDTAGNMSWRSVVVTRR
jgi:hypothetical protein